MGLFDKIKKRNDLDNDTNLPAPPTLNSNELAPIPEVETAVKPKFPRIPIYKPKSMTSKENFESKVYEEEKFMAQQREMLEVLQPLFVKGNDYKDLISDLNETRNLLKQSESFGSRMEELHILKEEQFEDLREHIETIQHKLIFADKTLFK